MIALIFCGFLESIVKDFIWLFQPDIVKKRGEKLDRGCQERLL
jgi:hypothetical protein